jgi:hypothetical protein
MTLFQISQLGISIFGASAFLCVTREERKFQIIGCTLGILSNPFWWLMVYITAQWITIPVHLLYTYGWIRKIIYLWRTRCQS